MKNVIFVLYFFMYSFAYSQQKNTNYVIDFITTKQGLSHNYVTSVVSDDLNIKWIGTENGITKYNGYDFEYIKPSKEYKELLNENIETLFKDRDNNLWIGTKSGGLSHLDIKNNTVKNYNNLIDLEKEVDVRITAISQDNNGNIWVGTWSRGVFVIDYRNGKLLNHYKSNVPIYCIIKDFKGNIWFSINNNLFKYVPYRDRTYTYHLGNIINCIISDVFRKKIWISVTSKDNTKLHYYDYKSDSTGSIETGVKSGFSKRLSIDNQHRMWIGTWSNGVYRSNEDLSKFDKIELVDRNTVKISDNYNTVLSINHDKNNITWLGTANGGLVRLVEGNGFNNADKLILNPELAGNLNITSVYRNNDNIYVGTLFNGLYYGKDFPNLRKVQEIENTRIRVIYQHDRKLYIGGSNGFYIFDLNLQKIIFFSNFLDKVNCFYIDSDNNLYIGTQQLGIAIVKLDKINDTNAYTIYSEDILNVNKIESDRITSILEDQNKNIWISTYNGVHLYNKKTKLFKHQSKLIKEILPSIIVNSMLIKGSDLWLATPAGLFKLRYSKGKLTLMDSVTKENGINNDFICSVTLDGNSNIWVSTLIDIVKYNEVTKSIISYGDVNGIKTTSFNNSSFFNYKNEQIYFGGIDNITFFNPKKITQINSVPEVIFTNLRVNNVLIQYVKGSKILDNNINYAKEIRLTYEDNFFSTSFVANDFQGKLNIKYRYRLEGLNDSWVDVQNRNEINFAGLPPGDYTLKIEASRDHQNWSKPKSIRIIIQGSPWKSPFAIIVYFLVIILIIYYFIKSNKIKLKLENKLEIARIDNQKEMELTEAKLNFFTNISHEFRTPLTLIISPLKELLESNELSSKTMKNLNFIDRNTNRLLNLINQLLDFRKADHGLLKLEVSNGNFVRFSKEVFIYFKQAAKEKNLIYKFKAPDEEIIFPFDRYQMEIVLCNLLSNALKYTKPGDEVTMKVYNEGDYCVISINDTGIGMEAEYLDKIFDRFFQIKSSNTARLVGSGIGLSFSKKIIELHNGSIIVKSAINVGTEFLIKLNRKLNLSEAEINDKFLNSDNIDAYNRKDAEATAVNYNINAKEHSVLLIDDNLDILNYLKDILQDSYTIFQADNGDTGFEIASAEIPDLIISDIMMPGKDGITLCKELKNQITTSHIPIILLTARTSTVYEIEGLKTGADDYITKPFNSTVIKARISRLLENREKMRLFLLNKVKFEPTEVDIQEDSNIEDTFIQKAILLVEKNIDNASFGLENMVEELNISQSSLFRKIKSLTGLSITAFIRSIRLKKAAQLILNEDLNMNQIAYEVGFNDYKYFTISFKKQFNCLPSKYKEKINKKQ